MNELLLITCVAALVIKTIRDRQTMPICRWCESHLVAGNIRPGCDRKADVQGGDDPDGHRRPEAH